MASKQTGGKKIKKKTGGIFVKNILTRKLILPFHSIGNNLKKNIQEDLEEKLYGKCSKEGYIKENSLKILSHSAGEIHENNVLFDVMFECLICHPVEGQLIKCKAKNITRAGIRAVYYKEEISPITVFIARDSHYNKEYFKKVKEEQEIIIRVIGIKYELNDETISILAELKPPKKIPKTKVILG